MKKQTKKPTDYSALPQVIFGFIIWIVCYFILIKIIIPMILNIVGLVLILYHLFKFLDTNTMFLGGCFFLVVLWYVYGIIASITYQMFHYGYELIKGCSTDDDKQRLEMKKKKS